MILNIKKLPGTTPLSHVMTDQDALQRSIIEERETVRGIMVKDGKVLVVYGDGNALFGTPGGGVLEGETKEQALKREMKEEVGANDLTIMRYLGYIREERVGKKENVLYIPIQHYYLIDIHSFGKRERTEKEERINLEYTFIPLEELIMRNQKLLNGDKDYKYFYYFQTELFKLLKNHNLV